MMNWLKKLIMLRLLMLVIQLQKAGYSTKVNEIEKQTTDHNHDKYITTQIFNKLTSDNFTARLKKANLASKKSYFDSRDYIDQMCFVFMSNYQVKYT